MPFPVIWKPGPASPATYSNETSGVTKKSVSAPSTTVNSKVPTKLRDDASGAHLAEDSRDLRGICTTLCMLA